MKMDIKGLKLLLVLVTGAIIGLLVTSSCDFRIDSGLEPCKPYVRYRYDYNLLHTDAFSSQVKEVTLFVYDTEGVLVTTLDAEGNPFAADFTQELTLAPGNYRMVAWAGWDHDSYRLKEMKSLDKMRLEIANNRGNSAVALNHLWHGIIKEVEVTGMPDEVVEIPLVKDTNTFKVQLLSSRPLTEEELEKYQVSIKADNGVMNGFNKPVGGNVITYRPYLTALMDVEEEHNIYYGGAVYEIRTGRLMESAKDFLILSAKEEGGEEEEKLKLNLQDLLADLRLSVYSEYPFQEYLDRQDQYVVSLIFDQSGSNTSLKIVINGWLIRQHNIDL